MQHLPTLSWTFRPQSLRVREIISTGAKVSYYSIIGARSSSGILVAASVGGRGIDTEVGYTELSVTSQTWQRQVTSRSRSIRQRLYTNFLHLNSLGGFTRYFSFLRGFVVIFYSIRSRDLLYFFNSVVLVSNR